MRTQHYTYGLFDVVRRLGRDKWPGGRATSNDWRSGHVNGLIANAGFPKPLPDHTGSRIVNARSRWQLEPVDCWFDGETPADALGHANPADLALHAADMDNRATNLRVVQGGRA